jgi:hypothetical protein
VHTRVASFPLLAALLAASVLLASLTASPTIGAGSHDAVAKKKKKKKKKKNAPIRGKLSKRGYTVIALADNGVAKAVLLRRRSFRLRPPAKRVTLQLRAPDGTYAGPVILDSEKHGKRAIVGVRAGAKLGQIKVKGRKGYAKLAHKSAKRWIKAKRWARARHGVPIGNGRNVGLVRSGRAHGRAADPDRDGVPNPPRH